MNITKTETPEGITRLTFDLGEFGDITINLHAHEIENAAVVHAERIVKEIEEKTGAVPLVKDVINGIEGALGFAVTQAEVDAAEPLADSAEAIQEPTTEEVHE